MTVLRIVVPLLVLTALWHLAGGQAALARAAAADPGWLALAFAALHLQTLLSALRWRRVAVALGQPVTGGRAVREYYVAQFLNQMLPGGVFGDAARATRTAAPGGFKASATAVVAERAVGQGAMLLVLAAGMTGSLLAGRIAWPAGTGVVALAVVLALVAGGVLSWRSAMVRHAVAVAVLARGVWRSQAALSAAIVAVNLVAFAAVARATDTHITLEAAMTVIPLVLCAMLIPLSVAGWGWREGAAAALFPLAGATAEAGLAASALYGASMLLAAVPGAFWLARPGSAPVA